jgi:hypothetical protein
MSTIKADPEKTLEDPRHRTPGIEKWMALTRDISIRHKRDKNGAHTTWALSPYDVPYAIRRSCDKSHDICVLTFRYVTDEPTYPQPLGESLVAHLGKNSRRVYGLDLDMRRVTPAEAPSEIVRGIEQLREGRPRHVSSDRYRMVERLIEASGDELFGVS